MNLLSVRERALANLEIWEGQHALFTVLRNYSHENMYKQPPFRGELDSVDASTAHRQQRLDALPAPRNALDVSSRLGDTADTKLPIYRPTTLATVLLDGGSNELSVWENANPSKGPPTHVWNLSTFFRQSK